MDAWIDRQTGRKTDLARSFVGLFPSLISALILIYIYEALLCTPTSQLPQQQVFGRCSIQPRPQTNTQNGTLGMKPSILLQDTHIHTHIHTCFSSKHFLEVDELHFWSFQGQKELYVSLQSTGACGIPMLCLCVCLLLCAVAQYDVCVGMEMSPLSMAKGLSPSLTRQIGS